MTHTPIRLSHSHARGICRPLRSLGGFGAGRGPRRSLCFGLIASVAAFHAACIAAQDSTPTATSTAIPAAIPTAATPAAPTAGSDAIVVVGAPGAGQTPEYGAIQVGMAAPDFELPDLDGTPRKLSELAGRGQIVVLQWYNPTCRFIIKYHEKHDAMRELYERFGPDSGVLWLAVNSGSIESGTADPALNRERVEAQGVQYPILLDPDGCVGRLYGAKVTPQFFLIDGDGVVRWIGPVDNEPSDRWLGKRQLLGDALAALSSGSKPDTSNVAPFGCAVKYANSRDLEVTP